MSAPTKRNSSNLEVLGVWIVVGAVLVLTAAFSAGYWGGAAWGGYPITAHNPFTAAVRVLQGKERWSVASTVFSVLALLVLGGLALAALLVARKPGGKRSRVDAADRYMGRGRDIAHLTAKGAQKEAARLGVPSSPGLPLGRTLAGQMLFSGWENVCVDIWGPRTGKTTSRVIPGILAAPGAVLGTSNKRDILDGTRGVREQVGRVFVFDPQGVAGEPATWWWNPLSYVVDDVTAKKLAGHFAMGSRDESAKTDAFFDPAGRELLAGLLLAAALSEYPITRVHYWLTHERDDTAVMILSNAGWDQMANTVRSHMESPDKQRGGVYGTARQMAECLNNRAVLEWITPTGPDDTRPQFDPAKFLDGRNTLYSLSMEGEGTSGPLVTALTVAVAEAAVDRAIRHGGRLPVPLVIMLDEAANICRWGELPALYSHYGSRGIVISTILQSWSQGERVWGPLGMKQLWSAANVSVYGGGVDEPGSEFIQSLSRNIGEYTYENESVSRSRQGTTRSRNLDNKDVILAPSDLVALPRGRAVAFVSGAPAVLLRTVPWYEGPEKAAVEASLDKYDPARAKNRSVFAGAGS